MPHERTNKSTVTISLGLEEAAELHHFLNAQRALKRKRREVGSVSEEELTDSHDNHLDANDDDDGDTSWIGVMVKAPPGERGRGTNTEGRLGFKNEGMLMHAGITSEQWGRYMSTGHRLVNRHFDITKSWRTNTQNNPDGWWSIISEMQEHHPRFLYHDANWLIRHIAISHLTSMNRKFRRLGVDPDVRVYQQYLESSQRALKGTTERRTEMRGPMPHGIYKVPVPAPPARKTTNNSALMPSSNSRFPTGWVPNVRANKASLQKVPSSDSETETDCEFSDLDDEEPPNKKRKPCTQTEVPVRRSPVRRSQRRSQRAPASPLDAPANPPTSKTCHDRLSTGNRYGQDEQSDKMNVPPKNTSAAKKMAVNRNGTHLETESRVARSKGKAKVLLVESESEDEIPYPRSHHQRRHVNNPSRPHIDSLRRSTCKRCGFNN